MSLVTGHLCLHKLNLKPQYDTHLNRVGNLIGLQSIKQFNIFLKIYVGNMTAVITIITQL